MKARLLRVLFPALFFTALLLGGCGHGESTLAPLRENETLRDAARAVIIGKTFDRAAVARRNRDTSALQAAAAALEKLDSTIAERPLLLAAEQLVVTAVELDSRAMRTNDAALKKQLEAQASEKYREALQLSPEFPSRNAQLLNALGYFLADRGSSTEDFQIAERLTRESLRLLSEAVKDTEGMPLSGTVLAARRFSRASGPQDSMAWALFKQGRFEEARREQLAVIKEAEETAPQIGRQVSADLYFHLAEMERALGNLEAAKVQYQKALTSEPEHAASRAALASLQGKNGVVR